MGYDLYWNEQPSEVTEAYARLGENRYAEEDVRAWVEAQQRTGCYFRANIWSMGQLRAMLDAHGALADVPAGKVNADSNANGIPAYKLGSNEGWLITPREIRAALEQIERSPLYVVADGSGVDLAEYASGFERKVASIFGIEFDAETADDFLPYWREFVEWLRSAAEHGGARVW